MSLSPKHRLSLLHSFPWPICLCLYIPIFHSSSLLLLFIFAPINNNNNNNNTLCLYSASKCLKYFTYINLLFYVITVLKGTSVQMTESLRLKREFVSSQFRAEAKFQLGTSGFATLVSLLCSQVHAITAEERSVISAAWTPPPPILALIQPPTQNSMSPNS